jgi:hypothetical protein
MTTTTTIPGPSGDKELNGWYAYLGDGGYTDAQSDALAERLLHEQMTEFDALLPEGWTWSPAASQIVLPADQRYDAAEMDRNELLEQASAAVIARFEKIVAEVLDA